jgi:succinate-semialdehyde dehydrogenase/glutarate-semialdehyde dehydrogenase
MSETLSVTAVPAAVDTVDSVNPATGQVCARIPATPSAELPEILARARAAQRDWAARTVRERCELLRRFGARLYERRDEVAALVTREAGKPRVEALFADVLTSLDTASYYARRAPRLLRPERVPHHNPALKAKRGRLWREPVGVIGLIAPWNYPLAVPLGTLLPALAAGNAVIVKPSELVPACGALLGELAREAGAPEALVQVIQGRGQLGAALIEAGPDKVVFTGSVATGRRVAQACAARLIPSVLELGGKDAMVVLSDADLERASSAAVWGGFTNCGQACLSVERLYVERKVARPFLELCVAKARKLRLGDPADAATDIGPLIRPEHRARVLQQLEDAVSRGARILAGGRPRNDLGPSYLEPAVITDVTREMLLMREETFGPVLPVTAVENEEEAVRAANESRFALGASVWSAGGARGQRVAAQLRAGSVMINDVASYFGICEAPHGGWADSGWGRTHARAGFEELVRLKYVDVDALPGVPKAWWYGYNQDLLDTAREMLETLFAPRWSRRVRSAARSARVLWRRGRI